VGVESPFWQDLWCGVVPLGLLFCELIVIAVDRDATIVKYMHRVNNEFHRCPRFLQGIAGLRA
jgi:hypothetical protein